LTRETYDFPDFVIKKDIKTIKDLEELEWDDVELLNYNS
jgi:thymidylate synthase